jgi:predicted  nucleic acid-binding Zn-ribbon protein
MSVAKRLYELQQIDLDIQKKQEALDEVSRQLGENTSLNEAKAQLIAAEEHLAALTKQQREMEWELDDLRNNIKQLSGKLYDGKIKNPKELLGLEHEVGTLKSMLKQKEDKLLDLMSEVETSQHKVKYDKERFQKLGVDRQREQEVLTQRQSEVSGQLSGLQQDRQAMVSGIAPEALGLYEGMKSRKAQVVVRVEQGMCKGCRLTLPMSEWQRAKAGNLVQCSSCGRILYLG